MWKTFEGQPTVFLQRRFWGESKFAYGEPRLLPFPFDLHCLSGAASSIF